MTYDALMAEECAIGIKHGFVMDTLFHKLLACFQVPESIETPESFAWKFRKYSIVSLALKPYAVQHLNLKPADIPCLGVKNDANQIPFSTIFLVIPHHFDLLKWLPVGHLEFKEKGLPADLQGQVNSAPVAHTLGNDVHPNTGKTGIEYAGVKALETINVIVGVIIIGDTRKKALDNGFQTSDISCLKKIKQLIADQLFL